MADYKHTINLPADAVPHEGGPRPARARHAEAWEEQGTVRASMREVARGRPRFVLHDGPPYANGDIHIGHAVNKILKDIIVKSRSHGRLRFAVHPGLGLPRPADRAAGGEEARPAGPEAGCRTRFVPRAAPSRRRRSSSSARTSSGSACSATGTIPIARWTRATRRSRSARSARSSSKGHLYKGVKPVHWCFDCRSALAEAEVEYEEKTSQAIDVGFAVVDNRDLEKRIGLAAGKLGRRARSTSSSGRRRPGRCPATRRWRCATSFDYALVEGRASRAHVARI